MSLEKISEFEQMICKEYPNITGIVIRKNGEIAYEQYFNECTPTSRFHIFSVTKSILSLLIGIAIDKGYLKSIHQHVLDFFPDYSLKRGENKLPDISIQDMLTMTVPHRYRFPTFTYLRYFMSSDWAKFGLDSLGGKGEIGVFNYVPFAVADVLSSILTKVTGHSAFEFAREYLFVPLGMTVEASIHLRSAKEQQRLNKSTNISGWVIDGMGVSAGGWGLTLSTTDMAKIGQLCLNRGLWQGQQIVSATWIEESMKEHSRWEELSLSYGYLWWLISQEEGSYAAMGDGGNIIYINHKKDLSIAISSMFVKSARDRIGLISEYIEPMFYNIEEY